MRRRTRAILRLAGPPAARTGPLHSGVHAPRCGSPSSGGGWRPTRYRPMHPELTGSPGTVGGPRTTSGCRRGQEAEPIRRTDVVRLSWGARTRHAATCQGVQAATKGIPASAAVPPSAAIHATIASPSHGIASGGTGRHRPGRESTAGYQGRRPRTPWRTAGPAARQAATSQGVSARAQGPTARTRATPSATTKPGPRADACPGSHRRWTRHHSTRSHHARPQRSAAPPDRP
jgi:hypothetical protein